MNRHVDPWATCLQKFIYLFSKLRAHCVVDSGPSKCGHSSTGGNSLVFGGGDELAAAQGLEGSGADISELGCKMGHSRPA